jgi:hypothetical protein
LRIITPTNAIGNDKYVIRQAQAGIGLLRFMEKLYFDKLGE